MISASAMGLIFPNLHDDNLPELVANRTMGSLPFAGRYRMIDFCLSSMSRAGIQSIGIVARNNYLSLMDHLGSGREWDLSSKRGGLVIFPPYASDVTANLANARIWLLSLAIDFIVNRREELVVMSDCNVAYNMDYKQLLDFHRKQEADVTVLYAKDELAEGMHRDNFTISVDDDCRVTGVRMNEYRKGTHNLLINAFVMSRERLISTVREGAVRGNWSFMQDFLGKNLKKLRICGCEYTGYRARIYDMESYFNESLRLADAENLQKLFPEDKPIYTKVRDEAPVRYAIDAQVKRSLVADGCIVEGELEHCVLFRGVRVGKGAKLKNCVIMQGNDIGPGVQLENVVTDKNVRIGEGQHLRGASSLPVFVAKGCKVL